MSYYETPFKASATTIRIQAQRFGFITKVIPTATGWVVLWRTAK